MLKKLIVTAALTLGSTMVRAQESAWYGGLDLGASHLSGLDIGNALGQQGIAVGSSSVDHSDTAFGFDLGYRVNRNFAVEGAYTDLGKFKYSTDTFDGSYRAKAFSLAGVGILPLESNWSLYGKAGIAHTQAKLDAPSDASDTRNGLLVGAGAMYDINRNVYAKAGWDRYASIGSDAIE